MVAVVLNCGAPPATLPVSGSEEKQEGEVMIHCGATRAPEQARCCSPDPMSSLAVKVSSPVVIGVPLTASAGVMVRYPAATAIAPTAAVTAGQ
jgi:hypothetical protein